MKVDLDLYAILGVSPKSEDVVIQAAYRALIRRYHPDTNTSAEAARKSVEINAAYAVLGDPEKRATYDQQRAEESSKTDQATSNGTSDAGAEGMAPPEGMNAQSGEGDARRRSKSGLAKLTFAALILGSAALAVAGITNSLSSNSTSEVSNSTMNVDENLTTDFDAEYQNSAGSTEMILGDAESSLNASATFDANELGAPILRDLSSQTQSPVSYSTVEAAAWRFATVLRADGIVGARSHSERCHKKAQASPTWEAADACAAFDYAAAYVDGAFSRSAGLTKNGYFEFQQENQSDNYTAIGAPSYLISTRLSQIRRAAEASAADAVRTQIAREGTVAKPTVPTSDPETAVRAANSM